MAKEIRSINALAELVGKSAPAVQQWVKHPDWTFGAAPWPVTKLGAIKEWAKSTLQEDRSSETAAVPDGGMQMAKKALITAKAMLAQHELKEKREEVHNIAECEQRQTERVQYTKLVLVSHVPMSAVQEIRERERQKGRQLADLEVAEVIRGKIEDAIQSHLAGGPPSAQA